MKKVLNIILAVCLVLLLIFCFTVLDLFHMGKFRLSALNNRLGEKFLISQSVVIPEEFRDLNFQWFFAVIENDPYMKSFGFGSHLEDFSKEILKVVRNYYGITPQGG